MVTFDTTFLTLMFLDRATHEIPDAADRVKNLLLNLSGAGTQVLIPTPSLSEILVKIGDANSDILKTLNQTSRFVIAPFDEKAAIELSIVIADAIATGGKKRDSDETWTKIKFDNQIVAISKVNQVSAIYSDDKGVKTKGEKAGIKVLTVNDIPIPKSAQTSFNLQFPSRQAESL